MEAGLTPGMSIKVTRVTSEVVVRQVRVPYRIEENLIQAWIGVKLRLLGGELKPREEKVRVTYEDGRVVNETVLSSKVLREAVSKW